MKNINEIIRDYGPIVAQNEAGMLITANPNYMYVWKKPTYDTGYETSRRIETNSRVSNPDSVYELKQAAERIIEDCLEDGMW